ncbi:MAG: SusC/RagA family TonB-linked outer membrane protein [Chitinophagales bacterium]
MKKKLVFWLLGLILSVQVFAQTRTISGTVTDAATGEALIGVNVTGKGTDVGTVTDIDGNYTLELAKDITALVFSYVGFTTIEKPITSLVINAAMGEDAQLMDEVVITGMQIKREKRSTSFATQTISGDDLNKTSSNALSALQGKVAGVKINSTSGQIGSSTRIVIRGEKSLTGDNNALIVVDGVPINNSNQVSDNFVNDVKDYGNRGMDLNPEDIESTQILSGPAAVALYGTRGANGVILITTKSGKMKDDNFKVSIKSGMTFDKVYNVLERQNQYGEGYYPSGIVNGENFSWGPAFDGIIRPWTSPIQTENGVSQLIRPYSAIDNHLESFFNTGITLDNNVSIQGNNDKFTYYLSYGNLNNTGILPYSYYKRHNVTFNASADLSDKFSTSFGVKYVNIKQDSKVSGREFANPYMAAIQTPVNIPFHELRDYNSPYQDLAGYYGSYTPNPYFILANTFNENYVHNIIGNFELNYKPIEDLTLTARFGDNIIIQNIEEKQPKYDYTLDNFNPDNLGGERSSSIGSYNAYAYTKNDLSADLMATYNKNFAKDFNISLIGGLSYFEQSSKAVAGFTQGGLVVPNFYSLSNSSQTPLATNSLSKKRLLGLFANMNFGFKNMLFLEYSARNDWSSTLPLGNNNYFYQAGAFLLFYELFKNKWVNYIKIRGNAGTSGKDAPTYRLASVYVSNPAFDDYSVTEYQTLFPVIAQDGSTISGYTAGNRIGNPDLKPELTFKWEVGADVSFFDDRVRTSYTYYQEKSKNLIVDVSLPGSSGYTVLTKNVGKVSNKGHELTVFATPIRNIKNVTWDLRLAFSKNNNLVEKVSDETSELTIGGSTVANTNAIEGKPFGVWKVKDYLYDSIGRIIVGSDGIPLTSASTVETDFTTQPKYLMGFGSTLSWKGLSIDVQFDMSKGGYFWSGTRELAEFNGTSVTTLQNNREPYLVPNSVVDNGDGTYSENTVAVVDPYQLFGSKSADINYIIDASYIKLREASISYSLPSKLFKNVPLSGVTFSVVGRNLKFWFAEDNLFADPEANSYGGAGNVQGYEVATTPPARSYGFNVKIDF